MQSDEPFLHVRSRPALFRRTDQHSDRTRIDFIEKRLLGFISVCVVNIGDLFFRDTHLHELVFEIVVNVEVLAVFVIVKRLLRCGQIAEHDLRSFDVGGIFPNLKNTACALVDFAPLFVGRGSIETSRIESQFLAVRRDFEHIIFFGRYAAFGNDLRTLCNLVRKF